MTTIRTLIVDDEPLAREGIRGLLEKDADIEIVGEAANGADAVVAVRSLMPDLVFLDVQMPELNGFEVLERLGPYRVPVVIFVTAFDEYALGAFEVHALDYLLKPFDDERFERALDHAKQRLRQNKAQELTDRMMALVQDYKSPAEAAGTGAAGDIGSVESATPQYVRRLAIRSAGRVQFLKTEEIDWVEAADYYVKLHVGDESHLLRETMGNLEQRLDPGQFLRIHRSTIVNLDRVKELRADGGGEYSVYLRDETRLRLSRGRKDRLQTMLNFPE